MLTSIDVKFIFNCLFIGKFRRKRVVQFCKYSPSSRCKLMFLLCFLLIVRLFLPRETSEMFRHFALTTKNNPTSSPGLLG